MSLFSFFQRRPKPIYLADLATSYVAVTSEGSQEDAIRLRRYKRAVRQWIDSGGSDDARSVTTEQYATFRQAMSAAGYRPGGIESKVTYVNTLLRHAGPRTQWVPHGRGLIADVPWSGIPLVIDVEPQPPIPQEALTALYAEAHRFRWEPCECTDADFFRAWLVWGYHTGLRVGDLTTRLCREQIDREAMRLTIIPRKTRKHRRKIMIPVTESMLWHWDRLPNRDSNAAIFFNSTSQIESFREAVRIYCNTIGVNPVKLNQLRYTAADAYTRVNPIAGSVLLGHTTARQASNFGTPLPGLSMTLDHYTVACETILRPAQQQIMQPWTHCTMPPPPRKLTGGMRHPQSDAERQLVDRIVRMHKAGWAAFAIAREFARKNVPTISAMRGRVRQSRWHAQTVAQIVARWSVPQEEWESVRYHHAWTQTEKDLVGTMPDKALARQIGCTTAAVATMRIALGRPPYAPAIDATG